MFHVKHLFNSFFVSVQTKAGRGIARQLATDFFNISTFSNVHNRLFGLGLPKTSVKIDELSTFLVLEC